MSISLTSYVIYDIYGLMDVGWIWFFAIIVGMAGYHLKFSAMDTALIGGIIMEILTGFFSSLGPNWQPAEMFFLFTSTSYNFVLAVSIFLVGGGISYITYYELSKSGGKEKD